jgi:hypothetical protein
MLTPERLKNMELILGRLKMTNAVIVDALWHIDVNVLK